jgi:hypothetical protein
MSDDPGLLIWLNLKLPDMVAGFAGGVVSAIALKRSDPWSIIGSVVVGGFMSNYLSETFSHYVGTTQGTSGFLLGLGGMALAQGLIAGVAKWTPFKGSGNETKPGS